MAKLNPPTVHEAPDKTYYVSFTLPKFIAQDERFLDSLTTFIAEQVAYRRHLRDVAEHGLG